MSTFQSKYDAWLVLLLAAAAVVEGIAIVAIWRGNAAWPVSVVASSILAVSAAVIVWTLVNTRYMVGATTLTIRSGPIRKTIPISSIQSVQPSRSILAGPAWSLDRLRIESTAEELLISPKDRAGFLAALMLSDPNLQREGERLTRRASAEPHVERP